MLRHAGVEPQSCGLADFVQSSLGVADFERHLLGRASQECVRRENAGFGGKRSFTKHDAKHFTKKKTGSFKEAFVDYLWYPLAELMQAKKVAHIYKTVEQMRTFCKVVGIEIHCEDNIEGGLLRKTPGHGAKK